ncbi:MAG: response regulator [Verrucomicrobiota bacterium]
MRILIAEDDLTSRIVVASVLKKSGHEVVETVNGFDAWQALQQPDAPRLVILDWMMPVMDGPEVLRRIRALPTERPSYIIMLTARSEKASIIAGLDAGANDYLAKPFDPGELNARVEVGQRMVEMQDALATKVEELRQSQAALHVLTARMQAVREEERSNLARELHDAFGQHLTALQIDLMGMDRHLQTVTPPDLALLSDRIVAMVPLIERLTEQTQTMCAELRPSVLFELGLPAAIEWQAEETAARSGLVCHLALPAADVELHQDLALALFRIVQESLTNVVRHAQATRVDIRLDLTGSELNLAIEDNGRGFPPQALAGSKALGLLGMCERIGAFCGTVDFSNGPAGGALVHVRCTAPMSLKS